MSNSSIPQIKELMLEYYNQVPNRIMSWYNYTAEIYNNDTLYYQQFYDILSNMDETELKIIYKKFRTKPPTIIFKDIIKKFIVFDEKKIGVKPIITIKMDVEIIKRLLAYTIIIEAVVPNYIDRINELFGW